MNDTSVNTIFELIGICLGYIGAVFHWILFLGKKSFSKVIEHRFINGLVGFVVLVILILAFKGFVLELILQLINKRLNKN
jgi:H+/Cl- antiporter ClcA